MINSMTGFGRAVKETDGRRITLEIKSVNHRYLDMSLRAPKHIGFIEDAVRNDIRARLSRGHVDVFVSYDNFRSDARTVMIDKSLLGLYIEAGRKAAAEYELVDDITLANALRLPDVTEIIEAEEDRDAVTAVAREALDAALDELCAMRKREGERLLGDLEKCVDSVEARAAAISEREPLVVEEYRQKLNERITALLGDVKVDELRLATEVALFADRASIHEELIRISSHIKELRALMKSSEAVGRRLDFLVQELNREFNTIGSKASVAAISANVISAKSDIEKIREQIQNIE